MMNKLVPDYIFQTIHEITPSFLRKHGIQGVLIDLDGTLASRKAALPPEGLAAFFQSLRENGFQILVFSNNRERRVGRFCQSLGVEFLSRAGKPFLRGFRLAVRRLGLPPGRLAMIGDQIFTDVLGGNRIGILTCYVQTLDRHSFWAGTRYRLERVLIKRGKKCRKPKKEEGAEHD